MRQSIMSRWSTDNKDDQGISKMIYKLAEQLLWVEKEKVLDWFGPAGLTSLIQASNPKLDSVTKILNNFENPKILDEKFESYDEAENTEDFKTGRKDKDTLVAKYYAKELENSRKKNNGMKR